MCVPKRKGIQVLEVSCKNYGKLNDELQELLWRLQESPQGSIEHSLKWDCRHSQHYAREARRRAEEAGAISVMRGCRVSEYDPETQGFLTRTEPTVVTLQREVTGLEPRPFEPLPWLKVRLRHYSNRKAVYLDIRTDTRLDDQRPFLEEVEGKLKAITACWQRHSIEGLRRPQASRSFILEDDGSLTSGRIQCAVQRLPESQRLLIKFNGGVAAESDLSAMHPSIAYCAFDRSGVPLRDIDFYREGYFRAMDKAAWVVMLSKVGAPFTKWRSLTKTQLRKLAAAYPDFYTHRCVGYSEKDGTPQIEHSYNYKPQDIREAMVERFPWLNGYNFDAALLQRLESDWMLDVLVRLSNLDIPALPVHDSLVYPADEKKTVLRVMEEEFIRHFGQSRKIETTSYKMKKKSKPYLGLRSQTEILAYQKSRGLSGSVPAETLSFPSLIFFPEHGKNKRQGQAYREGNDDVSAGTGRGRSENSQKNLRHERNSEILAIMEANPGMSYSTAKKRWQRSKKCDKLTDTNSTRSI